MPPRRSLLNIRGNMPDTVNLVNHGSYNNRPHNRDASDVITLVIIRKGVKRNLGVGHLHKKTQFWIHHESKMLTVMVPTMLGVQAVLKEKVQLCTQEIIIISPGTTKEKNDQFKMTHPTNNDNLPELTQDAHTASVITNNFPR